ncbi:hypothetical protein AD998_21310 [bacterium 336/3]|nr:hypothetical protein AD998_21310 [bacterium 336/3]
MKLIKYIIIAYLTLGLEGISWAQDDCLNLLKQSHQKALDELNNNEEIAFTLRVTNHYQTPDSKNISQNTEQSNVVVKGKKLHYNTPDIELIQDEKKIVVVFKNEKRIYIYNQNKKIVNGISGLALQTELLKNAQLKECVNVLELGKKLKKVTLKVPSNYVQKSMINEMVIWIDETSQEMIKSSSIYDSKSPIKKIDLEIIKKEKVTGKSIIDDFTQSKIINKYPNFTVIEEDKKNTKNIYR